MVFFVTIFLVAILGPVYEEFIFRGIILETFEKIFSFKVANLLQSMIFALVHLELKLIPFYVFFGLLTGILKRKCRGLGPSMTVHIINNLIFVALMANVLERIR